MEILIGIIIVAFLAYNAYDNKQKAEERIVLIRELSVALKTTKVDEYNEALPYYDKEEKEVIEDELVSLEDMDPTTLLRSL